VPSPLASPLASPVASQVPFLAAIVAAENPSAGPADFGLVRDREQERGADFARRTPV